MGSGWGRGVLACLLARDRIVRTETGWKRAEQSGKKQTDWSRQY
jgi:hypothetical protein